MITTPSSKTSINTIWKALFLVGLAFIIYSRVIHGQFLWDDDDYVTHNLTLRSFSGLAEIWFHIGRLPQYYPMTFTSFWADYHLWQLNPVGYHCVNILLHAANGLLVWRLLDLLKVKYAWFIALLFTLHPVNVESVAWITERKNVLSGLFFLASIIAYLKTRHIISYILFIAALCSKTVTATLPITLVLILWWRDGKFPVKDTIRLALFVLTAFVFTSITIGLENQHVLKAGGVEWNFSLVERVLIAGRGIWFYLTKLLYPYPLMFIYPRWQINAQDIAQWLYPVSFLLLVTAAVLSRKRLGRGPVALIAIFVITLAPALGFRNFFPMRFSFVADHFQYLATIPGIILLCAAVDKTLKNNTLQKATAVLVLTVAAFLSWQHGHAFTSQEALWQDTLNKNPGAWIAHNNLGTIFLQKKMEKEAFFHFNEALRLKPDHAEAFNNLGLLKLYSEKTEQAVPYFQKAVALQPYTALFELNLGVAFFSLNDLKEAEAHFREALKKNPRLGEAYFNLGNIFLEKQMLEEAKAQFQEAVRFSPEYADAHTHLGYCYAQSGKTDEAMASYRQAIKLDPKQANAHNNLANALSAKGLYHEAEPHYIEALKIDPSSDSFQQNYADLLKKKKAAATGKQPSPAA